jgi:hypothetical protein
MLNHITGRRLKRPEHCCADPVLHLCTQASIFYPCADKIYENCAAGPYTLTYSLVYLGALQSAGEQVVFSNLTVTKSMIRVNGCVAFLDAVGTP